MSCLKAGDNRLKSILKCAGATAQDYSRIIHHLVRTYAHPRELLAIRATELDKVREIDSEIIDWRIG